MTNYKLRITNWFTPKYKYFTKNKSESYFLTIPMYKKKTINVKLVNHNITYVK